jgi:hypothetical protein
MYLVSCHALLYVASLSRYHVSSTAAVLLPGYTVEQVPLQLDSIQKTELFFSRNCSTICSWATTYRSRSFQNVDCFVPTRDSLPPRNSVQPIFPTMRTRTSNEKVPSPSIVTPPNSGRVNGRGKNTVHVRQARAVSWNEESITEVRMITARVPMNDSDPMRTSTSTSVGPPNLPSTVTGHDRTSNLTSYTKDVPLTTSTVSLESLSLPYSHAGPSTYQELEQQYQQRTCDLRYEYQLQPTNTSYQFEGNDDDDSSCFTDIVMDNGDDDGQDSDDNETNFIQTPDHTVHYFSRKASHCPT